MYEVGEKGQVVIAKEIRKRLGIERGWATVQRLVGDHLEIYFIPPLHRQSLKGSLASFTSVTISPGTEWESARETAWLSDRNRTDGGEK